MKLTMLSFEMHLAKSWELGSGRFDGSAQPGEKVMEEESGNAGPAKHRLDASWVLTERRRGRSRERRKRAPDEGRGRRLRGARARLRRAMEADTSGEALGRPDRLSR